MNDHIYTLNKDATALKRKLGMERKHIILIFRLLKTVTSTPETNPLNVGWLKALMTFLKYTEKDDVLQGH